MTTDPWAALVGTPLESHRDFLRSVARPAIAISFASSGSSHSRFGGSPDLPVDFSWPHHASGPYRFIAQIACAELPARTALPDDGLISFFHAWDEEGGSCQGVDAVIAIHIRTGTTTRSTRPPAEVVQGPGTCVRFKPFLDLPDKYQVPHWPLHDAASSACWDFRHASRGSNHHLLGFPLHGTLAYDPTPGPDWINLLNLGSNDDLEWCWHDGDRLSVFIPAAHLARGDFSGLISDAG